MTVIQKHLEFPIQDKNSIDKTIQYFHQSGFKITDRKEDSLTIKRGSMASNFWTFNPLNWKSEIRITTDEQKITVDLNINTIGQIPTLKEEQLWESFIENYKLFLTSNNFDYRTENQKALTATKQNSLKYFGWALIGGFIGGIPSGFIAYWTGFDRIVIIGAVFGALAFMSKKINEEKKKNSL